MKNLLKEKIALEEPVDVITEADEKEGSGEEEKVLPDAIPEEPIVVPTEPEITPEMENNALSSLVVSEIANVYADIESLKGIVATIAFESPEKQDVIDILNSIVDERTVQIGMLQQALSLIDGKHTDLVTAGEEQATAVAGEPANELEGE